MSDIGASMNDSSKATDGNQKGRGGIPVIMVKISKMDDSLYRLLYQVRGYPNAVYEFQSKEKAMAWEADMMEIKDRIAAINDGIPTPELYRVWLEEVYEFCQSYSISHVPLDIRQATNSVEAGIGATVTRWQW